MKPTKDQIIEDLQCQLSEANIKLDIQTHNINWINKQYIEMEKKLTHALDLLRQIKNNTDMNAASGPTPPLAEPGSPYALGWYRGLRDQAAIASQIDESVVDWYSIASDLYKSIMLHPFCSDEQEYACKKYEEACK
jgi:hypothetical protein